MEQPINTENLERLKELLKEADTTCPSLSYEESLELRVKALNDTPGMMTGYDCQECKNRGGSYFIKDECIVWRMCKCSETRKTLRNIEQSGVKELLEVCTFDNFIVTEPWQEGMKRLAAMYIDDHDGKWFYTGGAVGSGKTHICVAILGELIQRGIQVRYMRWRDESTRLKAIINEDAYCSEIEKWKSATVLYIDDFFKMPKGNPPTQADINLAFELLNHRYINRSLITIISSEHDIERLIDYDEAVGSRIFERSKEYCVRIKEGKDKNQRMKKHEVL